MRKMQMQCTQPFDVYAEKWVSLMKNLRNVFTNFNLDGASVNLGCKDSVRTRLLASVSQMIIIHCVNHCLELVVSVAGKGHTKVEDSVSTLEEVFKFYHYSPKKLRHLQRTS